jgi:hypothetical protein
MLDDHKTRGDKAATAAREQPQKQSKGGQVQTFKTRLSWQCFSMVGDGQTLGMGRLKKVYSN